MKPRVPYPRALEAFPTIRQSVLSSFDQCGLSARFEMAYRNGWSTHPQARGTMFHRFAGRALTEMNEQGEHRIEVDVGLAILHEVLRQEDADKRCPHCDSERIRRGVDKRGRRRCLHCKRYFETEFVNVPMGEVRDLFWVVIKWAHETYWSTENLVDVEKRLSAVLSYENPYGGWVDRTLTGQLDALFVEGDLDDEGVVIDSKDTWRMPPPTEVSFEGYFQQRFYAWLTMKNYRTLDRVTLREFYVRYSEPREATVYRADLDDIEAELAALVERFDRSVEQNVWQPTPGAHCSYCVRPTACPIIKSARMEGRIETQEEAARVAGQLIVAEAAAGQAKRALQSWSRIHGPVPVKDAKGAREWGYRVHPRQARPSKEEVERALREAGDIEHVNLDRLFRETQTTRFETYVPDPMEATRENEALLIALQESVAEAKAARR
jgi:hypothetical protein